MVDGGYEFDGRTIKDVSKLEIEECVKISLENGINNFAVTSTEISLSCLRCLIALFHLALRVLLLRLLLLVMWAPRYRKSLMTSILDVIPFHHVLSKQDLTTMLFETL